MASLTGIELEKGAYRVPGVQPDVVSMLKERERLFLVENPTLPIGGAVAHCSKDDLGDLEARFAESDSCINMAPERRKGTIIVFAKRTLCTPLWLINPLEAPGVQRWYYAKNQMQLDINCFTGVMKQELP